MFIHSQKYNNNNKLHFSDPAELWRQHIGSGDYSEYTSGEAVPKKSGRIYVHDALFSGLTDWIIYLNGGRDDRLLVAHSIFDSNSGSKDLGGCILHNQGASVHYRVCCIQSSYAKGYGYLNYDSTKGDSSILCHIEESTFSQSESAFGPLRIYGAQNHDIQSTNSSHNKASKGVCAVSINAHNFDSLARLRTFTACENTTPGSTVISLLQIATDRCNFISNSAGKNGIVSCNEWCIISSCIFSNNRAPYLFYLIGSRLSVSNCLIDKTIQNTLTTKLECSYEITTTSSLELKLVHSYCVAPNRVSLQEITLSKSEYTKGTDTTISATIHPGYDINSQITLYYWIDDSTESTKTMSKSSSYQFSVSIPSTLNSGTHTLNAKIIDNGQESNVVHKSFTFIIPLKFTLNNLQKVVYKRGTDSSISFSGSGIGDSRYDITINCQIDSTTYNINPNVNKNRDNTFTFGGSINFPNNFQEGSHTIHVWVSSNSQTTQKQSKEFTYERNTPILSITTAPKSKYIRNVDSSITISGTVSDKDSDETITIKSSFDGSSTVIKSTQISVRNQNNHGFSLVIEFPNDFSIGSHNVSIWAVDNNGKSTTEIDYPFTYVPVLSLSVDDLARTQYTKNHDETIIITGNGEADFSSGEDITIKVSIDNTEVFATTNIQKSEFSFSFSSTIVIPNYLSESPHELRAWAETSPTRSTTSMEFPKTFIIVGNPAILVINTPNDKTYTHNIDKSIIIDACVKDSDGYGSVTINAYFDEISETVNSTVIQITSTEQHCFDLYCTIPQTLKEGQHTIKLIAVDNSQNIQSNSINFNLNYNQPIIEILEKPKSAIDINKVKTIDFKLSIQDIDFNSNISIYYKFNNSQNINFLNETIPDDNPVTKDCKIPIPQDIELSVYQIIITAYDQEGHISEPKPFFVTFYQPSQECCNKDGLMHHFLNIGSSIFSLLKFELNYAY